MPFTFAHPAIILPLAKVSTRYFSITALIIGSLVPDFEYFLRAKILSVHSHTLSGLFYFDLPIGILTYILFIGIVRQPLHIHLPRYFRQKFDLSYENRHWIIVVYSVLLGAFSHLAWDSFTHKSGYVVERASFLQEQIAVGGYSLPVFKMLQHGSSLFGLGIIALVIIRMPKIADFTTPATSFWPVVLGTVFLFLAYKYYSIQYLGFGEIIVTAISGVLFGIIISSLVYHASNRSTRP